MDFLNRINANNLNRWKFRNESIRTTWTDEYFEPDELEKFESMDILILWNEKIFLKMNTLQLWSVFFVFSRLINSFQLNILVIWIPEMKKILKLDIFQP